LTGHGAATAPEGSDDESPRPGGSSRWFTVPVTAALSLYLLTTSRWGSYLGPPGAPIYIGDVLLLVAAAQAGLALLTRRASLRSLSSAPLVLLLVLSLAAWAVLLLAIGLPLRPDAPRDVAPYLYAITTLAAFLVPVTRERGWRAATYACLTLHAAWVLVVPRLPGFPWSLPVLGTDATMLVARPDFDAAVLGASAAYGLHDLLRHRPQSRLRVAALIAFVAVTLLGAATLETRAGLLAALCCVAAVALTARPRRSASPAQTGSSGRVAFRRVGAAVAVVGCVAVLPLTPTGSRLVDGLTAGSSQAAGTVNVRRDVWGRVTDFTLTDARRTAIGVGFGRNFIDESGSRNELEGTTFTKVRSPHNYLVGTLARLGVFGALVATGVLLLGFALSLRTLRRGPGAMTTLAALVAICVPVVSLLGVVLESPFGALPYFWAIGQLAASEVRDRHQVGAEPSSRLI
jgi:hypothetical protein